MCGRPVPRSAAIVRLATVAATALAYYTAGLTAADPPWALMPLDRNRRMVQTGQPS